MFENMVKFLKRFNKKEKKTVNNSKEAAKERLHLVLMQDRANVSADFLELMKQEIIEVIKKYIDVDESAIDVRLTNKENADGTNGAPALYANIPILNIKNEARKIDSKNSDKNLDDKSTNVEKEKNNSKESEGKVDKDNNKVNGENIEKERKEQLKQENSKEKSQIQSENKKKKEEKRIKEENNSEEKQKELDKIENKKDEENSESIDNNQESEDKTIKTEE